MNDWLCPALLSHLSLPKLCDGLLQLPQHAPHFLVVGGHHGGLHLSPQFDLPHQLLLLPHVLRAGLRSRGSSRGWRQQHCAAARSGSGWGRQCTGREPFPNVRQSLNTVPTSGRSSVSASAACRIMLPEATPAATAAAESPGLIVPNSVASFPRAGSRRGMSSSMSAGSMAAPALAAWRLHGEGLGGDVDGLGLLWLWSSGDAEVVTMCTMGKQGRCRPTQERHERGKKTGMEGTAWQGRLKGVSGAPALLSRCSRFISSCPRRQECARTQ